MDNIILTLHPVSDIAQKVLQDPRNGHQLYNDGVSQGKASALSLSLDRAPKRGTTFIIGRQDDADIVLTDPTTSARHCVISIDDKGTPTLHEQSRHGTLVNGEQYKNQSFEIQSGTQIDIRDAAFCIRIPWRGRFQGDYEHNVRRAKQVRAETPMECPTSRSAPIHTSLVETLGPYTLTYTFIDNFKLGNKELSRTEMVRKGCSSFAAKRYNREALGQREIRAWKKILDDKTQPKPNIIHVEDIIESDVGPVLIMELLSLGNLGKLFCENNGVVPHDIAISVMRQLLNALKYLHTLDIVHAAIRVENLLVSSKDPIHIKLTGFELSSCDGASVSHSTFVCPAPELWERYYRGSVAPRIWEEVLTNRGYSEKRPKPSCGSPVDIWSAGVVCSQLTLGEVPSYLESKKSADEQAADYIDFLLAVQSKRSTERSEAWAQKLRLSLGSIPSLLLNFLQKLLDPESSSRAEAEDCLTDPWLTQNSDSQDGTRNAKASQLEECGRKRRRLNSVRTR